MNYSPLVATDATDSTSYPLDFLTAHKQGIPHRAVHIEIVNSTGNYFVWERADGRLEIPGGHVDWIEESDRPESYEEAALRELSEELNLTQNWKSSLNEVRACLMGRVLPIKRIVNQLSSSHGNNNEWVTIFGLRWQAEWGDPCKFEFSNEGHKSARWLSVEEIKELGLRNPGAINSALRLFLQRRSPLVPLLADSAQF